MKRVSYVLAALATIAIAAPATAQDKPMMGKGDMGMHHSMHHHKMAMHHEAQMTHHKKMMMKKDGM